jgi:hypothetical protein
MKIDLKISLANDKNYYLVISFPLFCKWKGKPQIPVWPFPFVFFKHFLTLACTHKNLQPHSIISTKSGEWIAALHFHTSFFTNPSKNFAVNVQDD